jgi:hypothetical protein
VASDLNTQAALPCRSCGQDFVPHKHLFVGTVSALDPSSKRSDGVVLQAIPPPDGLASVARQTKGHARRWWWASGLLVLMLLLQLAVHQRNELAVVHPWFRVSLQAVCAALGCEVSPPQMLSDVEVVSSGFDQQPTGEFLLSLHVRHDQNHEVAMPFVELTLTDDFDRALVRKVFSPSQLGLPEVLVAGEGAQTEHHLTLDADLQPHVSGFRIELFYP